MFSTKIEGSKSNGMAKITRHFPTINYYFFFLAYTEVSCINYHNYGFNEPSDYRYMFNL